MIPEIFGMKYFVILLKHKCASYGTGGVQVQVIRLEHKSYSTSSIQCPKWFCFCLFNHQAKWWISYSTLFETKAIYSEAIANMEICKEHAINPCQMSASCYELIRCRLRMSPIEKDQLVISLENLWFSRKSGGNQQKSAFKF